MGETETPAFVLRLEQLRDGNHWSIAEMARRADLPKRSMENYFKGHRPGLDALVSMARGFGVTVDFLCGYSPPTGAQVEKIVYEAAYPTISSLVRRIGFYTSQGRQVFRGDTVFSEPLEFFVDREAQEVVQRFVATLRHVESTTDDLPQPRERRAVDRGEKDTP